MVMKVSSTEFQQNVGLYQKTALTEPVIITSYGRSQTVLISAAVFEVLSRGRVAERMEDLDDAELKDLAAAEVPAGYEHLDKLDLG
jgi:PHD/YefM family antitoxin component YafN of YafNO toxin-antitoxin module